MQLDHVIIGVDDLAGAVRTFELILGLPAAVRSSHPKYGTENALFLFEQGPYLELLALTGQGATGDFTSTLRAYLGEQGEGLYGLAFAPDDLDDAVQRLRHLGVDAPDAASGTGVSPGGRERTWRNTRVGPEALHGAFLLLIEHTGWDWRTELRRPPLPNRGDTAVTGIHHVVIDVADADAASAQFTERFGLPVTETIRTDRMGAQVNIHQAGDATVEFVSPTTDRGPVAERIARRGAGLSQIAFTVRDLNHAQRTLTSAGLGVGDPAAGVLPGSRVARMEPYSAHGVAVQLISFEGQQ